ncbi:neuronal acetylcholine receptor subunit alpha-2-like [Ostrea edulis]|uniref:neuronal acetylcholine receptor subunit alpha-2-like n=1 Tax=Ostrea edulis TaxID=37623 RepID=UPI0024B000E1|nr:neuronal acetylcholine receptor subunit alpha-2-like [Ostrea edulis]
METIRRILLYLLLIVMFSARMCVCETSENLYHHLLRSSGYNPNIMPICETNKRLRVEIGLALRDIVEMIEKQQLMRLEVWVRLKWTDCLLKWDPSQFHNQTELIVPYSKIWIPDITLFEGTSAEGDLPNMEDFRADIHYTGTVMYLFPSVVTVNCKINVAYFPFDHQVCSLTFGSWIYSSKYIEVEKQKDEIDVSHFLTHNEWIVVKTATVKHNLYYDCCADTFQDVTFHIHITRKPVFYVVTIIFPCLLINMLTAAGFVLPPFSGEKISLQVTVFLSLTVYLLLVQDILPSSSENFPRIATYFALSMALICIACAFSTVVLYIYYRSPENHHISPFTYFIFLNIIRKILCVQSEREINNDEIVQVTSIMNPEHTDNGHPLHKQKSAEGEEHDIDAKPLTLEKGKISNLSPERKNLLHGKDNDTNEWELFACVINRFFMLVYIYLAFINCIVFASITIANYKGMEVSMN